MPVLQFRRRATVVLTAFVAAVVVMVPAPFVHPVACRLVCSANGNKLVAMAGVPPSVVAWDASPVRPLAHVRRSIPAARLASLVGAPLPARGPPLAS